MRDNFSVKTAGVKLLLVICSSIKSIDNVTFSNNKTNATYTNQLVKGGVIGNFGTIESITNTKFTGNTSSASYQAMGGAIFNADTGVINKISKSSIFFILDRFFFCTWRNSNTFTKGINLIFHFWK